MANETFISYSRRDSAFVDSLFIELNRIKINPWLDKEDIAPGVRWKQEILTAIQRCDNFVAVLSPNFLESRYCDEEVEYALVHNKRLIPVLWNQFKGKCHPALSELNWIDFTKSFDSGFNHLVELIESPFGCTFGDRLDARISLVRDNRAWQFPLYRNFYVLGRDPRITFSEGGIFLVGVNDNWSSREHCSLFRKDARWWLADGKVEFERGKPIVKRLSSNGLKLGKTWDSAKRLQQRHFEPLRDGMRVYLTPKTYFDYEELSSALEPQPDAHPTWS